MARWKVKLIGIEWDDGKGEYDVSEGPTDLEVEVNAEDKDEAIDFAMQDADEEFGSCIAGVQAIDAKPL